MFSSTISVGNALATINIRPKSKGQSRPSRARTIARRTREDSLARPLHSADCFASGGIPRGARPVKHPLLDSRATAPRFPSAARSLRCDRSRASRPYLPRRLYAESRAKTALFTATISRADRTCRHTFPTHSASVFTRRP